MDENFSKFEKDFSFVACLSSSSVPTSVWYINSCPSSHMTGVREKIIDISNKDLDLDVKFNDDSKVKAIFLRTISFQRESQHPIKVKDVLYVLGLEKTLEEISAQNGPPKAN